MCRWVVKKSESSVTSSETGSTGQKHQKVMCTNAETKKLIKQKNKDNKKR